MDVPIPEVPAVADATIVHHPRTGHECLLVTSEDGQRLAFGFEAESDRPGLLIVDAGLWLGADAADAPEHSASRFDAVEEAQGDDWLQALVAHPTANEWLTRIKQAHPDAYHEWFAQTQYEEGGEEGSG